MRIQLLVLGVILLAGCAEPVAIEDLPALPPVDTSEALPVVARQLDTLRARVSDRPRSARRTGTLGMAYLSYGFDAAAEAALRRARMLAPGEFKWLYYHAEALLRAGRMDAAVELLAAAAARRPDYFQAATRLGILHMRLGDLESARTVLAAVVAAHPDDIESRLALARACLRAGDLDEAIGHFDELLVRHGHIGTVYFGLADAWRRKGDDSKAGHYSDLAGRYRIAGFASADPLLSEVARMNLSDTPLIRAAERERQAGRDGKAIELLLAALERNPQGHLTHAALVGLYGAQKQFDNADKHYRRALDLAPPTASLQRNLGVARLHEGRLSEAREAFEQSLTLEDNNANAHALLGVVHLAQGETGEGIARLRRALEIQPDHALAQRYLSQMQNAAMGDQDVAVPR